jgi:hypothetical protein
MRHDHPIAHMIPILVSRAAIETQHGLADEHFLSTDFQGRQQTIIPVGAIAQKRDNPDCHAGHFGRLVYLFSDRATIKQKQEFGLRSVFQAKIRISAQDWTEMSRLRRY